MVNPDQTNSASQLVCMYAENEMIWETNRGDDSMHGGEMSQLLAEKDGSFGRGPRLRTQKYGDGDK